MSKNRLFHGAPTVRLIASVEQATVDAVDEVIGYPYNSPHPAKGNRSEFVRIAIENELARWSDDTSHLEKGQE
ncbi:toxin-antitoxin system protein [Halomonas sp. MCCC 1A11036]|uniref:Toxin-antitoxin system protein n=1 Tax=Billgrantia zhangzhouensis TaxID=2733481 RepID=A0ABS9AEQ9_9GAMM|nr:toxin-antitoxin system protein [Halomonas zhangzhouensis]MCE8020180.1 toxin-antitoxin system protein [Halomonas zhangzhouensis]NIC38733.1 toxin-antitoxin system protein [Halomonas desiderata]